jgi:hypothetical protein
LAEVTVVQRPVQDARLGAGLVQDLYLTNVAQAWWGA